MYNRIAHTFRIMGRAIAQYPLMLCSALLFLFAIQGLVDQAYGEEYLMTKIAITGSLGISLFFGMAMRGQRSGGIWRLRFGAAGFLFAFFFVILPADEAAFTERYIFLLVPLYILSHLLVAIAPFLFGGKAQQGTVDNEINGDAAPRTHPGPEFSNTEHQRFWHYNKTLFIHLFLTGVFTLVLAGGTQLALLAMNHLFNLGWDEILYVRVFLSIAILGSTLIFALFHIDGFAKMVAPTPYPTVIQFFTQFILIPLLLLYAGILYVYGVKILIDWELPRGWVSYLVLAYGVLGILALLLVEPLLEESSKKAWVGWFRRLFYYSMVPLLVLLFAAISVRIGQYGFTEARYYVLLLAIWLAFVSVYFIVNARPVLRTIPISLFIAGVAALILPFVNVFSVSVRSQQKAAVALLEEHDLLHNGTIDTDKEVPAHVVDELQDKYIYLTQRQSAEPIDSMLGPERVAQLDSSGWGFRRLFDHIVYSDDDENRAYFEIQSASTSYDIADYSHLLTIEHQEEVRTVIGVDSVAVRKILYGEDRAFNLTINGVTTDLLPQVADWAKTHAPGTEPVTVKEIVIPFRHGAHEGVMRMDQISATKEPDGFTYFFNRVDLLFKN